MTRSLAMLLFSIACLSWALPSPAKLSKVPLLPVSADMKLSPPDVFDRQSTPEPNDRKLVLPVGSPPLALEGYCPVTLVSNMVWRKGDVRYGAVHRGRTYLFASATEQLMFLASPDTYAPVAGGNDVCQLVDSGKYVSGRREFGLFMGRKIFLFASATSMARFQGETARYVEALNQLSDSLRVPLR